MDAAYARRLAILVAALSMLPTPVREAHALADLSLGAREEDMRVIGRDDGDGAGSAVAVGDVSGDGIADVIIGAPLAAGQDNGRDRSGEVAVVFGDLDLPSTLQIRNANRTFFGANTTSRLGTAVAVGDIDGDGVGEIIMGAPEANAPGSGEGAAYVFYGGSRLVGDERVDLADQRADLILWGGEGGARLGRGLVSGDFNGDGVGDLAVGAPGEGDRFNRDNAGVVYVFFGARGLPRGVELFPGVFVLMAIRGPVADAFIGASLGAGDVNDDGFDDLVIGMPLTGAIRDTAPGAAYVVFGGPTLGPEVLIDLADPTQVGVRIGGADPGDRFGLGVGVADINGDGIGDVLVGAPHAEFALGLRTGRAYAVFGRPFQRGTTIDLTRDTADVTLAGAEEGAELGTSVSGGDFDDDGFAEWVVGAPGADRTGQAYRIAGRSVWSQAGVTGALTQGARPGDRAGDVTGVGDVNGDGIDDLVIGSPSFDGAEGERTDGGAVHVVTGREDGGAPGPACSDGDGDGFRGQGRTCGPLDCDDTSATTYPNAPELCDDRVDNNCDGLVDGSGVDEDGDGWPGAGGLECGIQDCNDRNPSINPGLPEVCGDGLDNNCDGAIDDEDPVCSGSSEVCTNCVDDDGNGLGDLLEKACPAIELDIRQVRAKRRKGRRLRIGKLVVKGSLFDATFLDSPGLLSTGVVVALAFQDGEQRCIHVADGKRSAGGVVILRSVDSPPTVLRLKPKRSGRVVLRLEHKAGLDLPSDESMVLGIGLYADGGPYRGLTPLRAKGGRTLIRGR